MRIVILTFGSRGDVQPFVALGVGLQRSGYAVRLVAPARFADLAQDYGLEFVGLPGDIATLSRMFAEESGTNPLKIIKAISEFVLPLAVEVLKLVEAACADADLVIHTFAMTIAGHMAAQQRGIPDLSVQFFPFFASTSAFPALMVPRRDLGPLNRLSHALSYSLFFWSNRLNYAILRRSAPHLTARLIIPDPGQRHPLLLPFSPHVVPRPHDWGKLISQTGYWFLPEPNNWQPPAALQAFLASGPPPVYLGFGSMVTNDADRLLDVSLRALAQTGMSGVIQRGWANLSRQHIPANVCMIDDVPHSWLFPQMSAIVHHGGAGTTASALRSGVPSLVVYFTADQPFWGWRSAELGVGAQPIAARRLSADGLAQALRESASAQCRQRARVLGAQIAAENGVDQAVGIITYMLKM